MDQATVSTRTRGGHRARLLAAATECLREKGYARTTARDLVAASGTNLASIGYHFGSKEALLNEAIAQGFADWTAAVESAMFAAEGAGAAERFQASLEAMIGRFDELRPFLVSFVEALPQAIRTESLRERLATAYTESRAASAEMVRWAVESAGVEVTDAQAQALAAVGMAICDGMMLQWLLDPAETPSSAAVMEGLAVAVAAAAAPGGASAA
jgi:AcrR family transcriptional regulator